ncbi:MAG TPA: SEC-C metal-binding domain-containing protein [Anaerolineae bacterium]|nr:SEC-C metal-binding domain-containing protein [Anaerolineae bacterium]HQH37095.1 SEC-C metal-binding domain-containing protein [Anaerolineae bacterium]
MVQTLFQALLPWLPVRFRTGYDHPFLSLRSVDIGRNLRSLSAPPLGRNDPCPCGSGKKYKQCCGWR